MSDGYAKPLPLVGDLSAAYWDAAREGRLLLQRCAACGRTQFYPRAHCLHCFAPDPEWIEAAGTGHVHSFTVTRRHQDPAWSGDCPYVFALVELDEGVIVTANVIGIEPDLVAIGMPVRVRFVPATPEVSLPQFAPGGE